MNLKDSDKKLLNLLQQDDMCVPRITFLAHKLGLPASTVHERINILKREGYIKGFSAELDPVKSGQGFVAFVLGQLQLPKLKDEKKYFENAGELVSKLPFVQQVYFIAGEWDLIVKMRVKDINDYYEKVKKIVEYFDVRGQGLIATHMFKDTPKLIVE